MSDERTFPGILSVRRGSGMNIAWRYLVSLGGGPWRAATVDDAKKVSTSKRKKLDPDWLWIPCSAANHVYRLSNG